MFRLSILITVMFVSLISADQLWSLTNKGNSALKKEDFQKAFENFDKAAKLYPENREAQYNRALSMAGIGKFEEAKSAFDAIKFDDNIKNSEISYNRGRLADYGGDFAVKSKKVKEAKELYQEAIKQYADAIDLNSGATDAIKNIEITSKKLKSLPDEKENKDKKENKNNKDKKKNDKKKNKDNKKNDDQKKNGDQKDKPKDDNQKKNDKPKDKQNQNQQPKDKPKDNDQKEQPKPQPSKEDQKKQEAIMLLQQFSDDAKELNKPTKKVGVAVPNNGKDW